MIARPKYLVALQALSVAAVASLAVTASTSAAVRAVPRQNPNVLNVASALVPAGGVNPALIGSCAFFDGPAYDSLVTTQPGHTVGPGLATSWRSSKQNTVWDFTLRSGVKFSDGSPLTAGAVKKSLAYMRSANGNGAIEAKQIKSVLVTGPLSFRLTLTAPNPDLLTELQPDYCLGEIIGPKGLSNPSSLGTHTDGAGRYMIDPSQSISGTTYTYVPNPYYWNKPAVHWKKIVIKVITDPQAQYAALLSGAVDYTVGDYSTAKSVLSAGYQRINIPGQVEGLVLLDHGGHTAPALSDIRVRQALNYAVDRQAIAKAQFGGAGKALDTFCLPTWQGCTPAIAQRYPYDPAKAKQLLAAAGYPNGFNLVLSLPNFQQQSVLLGQLLVAQFAQVGVHLTLDVSTSGQDWANTVFSKTVAGYTFQDSWAPMALKIGVFMNGGGLDLWHDEDSTLSTLLGKANVETNSAKRSQLLVQAMNRLTDLGWFVMVASYPSFEYARPGLNVPTAQPGPDPADMSVTQK